jgi:hypothetical protein
MNFQRTLFDQTTSSHLKDVNFPPLPSDSTIKIIMGVDNSLLYPPILVVPNHDNDTDAVALQFSCYSGGLVLEGAAQLTKHEFSGIKKDPKKIFTNVIFTLPETHDPNPNKIDAIQMGALTDKTNKVKKDLTPYLYPDMKLFYVKTR